jgi:hypothetical protein
MLGLLRLLEKACHNRIVVSSALWRLLLILVIMVQHYWRRFNWSVRYWLNVQFLIWIGLHLIRLRLLWWYSPRRWRYLKRLDYVLISNVGSCPWENVDAILLYYFNLLNCIPNELGLAICIVTTHPLLLRDILILGRLLLILLLDTRLLWTGSRCLMRRCLLNSLRILWHCLVRAG